MTKFESLMKKSDDCCLKAISFMEKGDVAMGTFFNNASKGYKIKADKLKISEAKEEV